MWAYDSLTYHNYENSCVRNKPSLFGGGVDYEVRLMIGEVSSLSRHLGDHEQRYVSVLLLGFEAADEDRLKKIFQLAPETRRYIAIPRLAGKAPEADILLVNYDNPAALMEKAAILDGGRDIPVVAVSRGPLSEHLAHHIRGMLMATRVLGVFDKIPVRGPQAAPAQPAARSVSAESGPAQEARPLSLIEATPPSAVAHRALAEERPRPADTPPQAPTTPSQSPPPAVAPMPEVASGYRALVVDDSAAMQKSIELNLATLDQITAIHFADSGEQALEKAVATPYDLVFLDVMMPGMDGYETCSKLRKVPGYKKTPIIMVTGKTSPLDEVKGVMAGCTTYVTKPIQPEEFKKLASRILAWLREYKPQ
ncbi:response regulator [Methylomagnum sp.]